MAKWAHTCIVAHLVSHSHTCSSQHSPPTAWMKPLKTGMGRQQCVDWLGPRGYSSWKAVLHQAPLCLWEHTHCGACWINMWLMLSLFLSPLPISYVTLWWGRWQAFPSAFARYQPSAQKMGANTPIHVLVGLHLPSGKNVLPHVWARGAWRNSRLPRY